MNLPKIFKISTGALGRNKLRSLLTMLGIIIGVGAVIAMVAIGQGARSQVEAQIASLGTNFLMVMPGSSLVGGVRGGWGSMSSLTIEDMAAIQEQCPAVALAAPGVRIPGHVVYGSMNWFTPVQGTSPEFFDIRSWPVESGELFSDVDVKSANKVCVLGKTVAQVLFQDEDPIGKSIRFHRVPCRVVGVLVSKGISPLGYDQDDFVAVPYTTAQKKLSRFSFLGNIYVSSVSPKLIEEAQREVTELLRQRHRIGPGAEDDFTVMSQEDIAATAEETSRILTILLASIAAVSLIVGGIGIMNIMLVSVTERTREIGIRMAVGARSRDILNQFLVEALVLSGIGALIGVLVGVIASLIISGMAKWPTVVSWQSILLSCAFAGLVGVFFGFYPAQKASRLDPIEALRHE
jgi:putative ABC transport system permease protein